MKQHPVHALLTPPAGEAATPSALQRLALRLERGVPAPMSLPGLDWRVLLWVPTGRVRAWLDAPADDIVTNSIDDHAGFPELPRGDDPRGQVAPALLFMHGTDPIGRLPLRLHTRTLLPRTGPRAGPAIEIELLGFRLAAAALRGPSAGSSRIDVAWRRIDRASVAFHAPIARRSLRPRLVATTGTSPDQTKRVIDAAPDTDGSPGAPADGRRGGLAWSLTHG